MRTNHHHITFAIGFLPIALIALATPWGARSMEPTLVRYDNLVQNASKELQVLDRNVRQMYETKILLTQGRNITPRKSIAHSVLMEDKFDSTYEKYEAIQRQIASLKNRRMALKNSIDRFGDKIIYIDLSDQTASLIENDKIAKQFPISSGAYKTPTPTGKYQIHRKQKLRVSRQEIPYRMPNYMSITPNGAYGIHSLPYLGDSATGSDYWHEARSHIGIPVSHGCVRLLPEDSDELYELVDVGTPVYIGV